MTESPDDFYGELCDLFDQAISMGREGTFDDEPDTSPDRLRYTSPQARRFANAAARAILGDQAYEEWVQAAIAEYTPEQLRHMADRLSAARGENVVPINPS